MSVAKIENLEGVPQFEIQPLKGPKAKESPELPNIFTFALVHIGIYILIYIKYLRQLIYGESFQNEKRKEYPPLFNRFECAYMSLATCLGDCLRFPICSAPGSEIDIIERVSYDNWNTFQLTSNRIHCINLASFNYLGLSRANGACSNAAIAALRKYGLSTGNTRHHCGTTTIHHELERITAEHLGTEDAVAFGMGYGTSALGLPALVGTGSLVISDEENHASMILGSRLSTAEVKVFQHNDMVHLETILKEAIFYGQPKKKKHVPWKKILIIVEGIYSMEGSLALLPKIVELKKKYKAYLYVDEAHSIGVLGRHGRGVTEHFGMKPNDVDLLMGSYSKALGATGGFMAGSKAVIGYLRQHSLAAKQGWALSPPCAGQAIEALRYLSTEDGRRTIETLGRNSVYVRTRLRQMGMEVRGDERSPVIPVLVYHYSKLGEFVRSLMKRNVAVVGVGYPAVKLTNCRVRLCMAADHTQGQLDYVLGEIEQVADRLGLRHSRRRADPAPIFYDKITL